MRRAMRRVRESSRAHIRVHDNNAKYTTNTNTIRLSFAF